MKKLLLPRRRGIVLVYVLSLMAFCISMLLFKLSEYSKYLLMRQNLKTIEERLEIEYTIASILNDIVQQNLEGEDNTCYSLQDENMMLYFEVCGIDVKVSYMSTGESIFQYDIIRDDGLKWRQKK